jgi:hypothetical protein
MSDHSDCISVSILDGIAEPGDLRRLNEQDLRQVADELRAETISAVATTGGHLGAGLGVVELTVALHYVFDTPRDKLIWDVGHQAYPHKILTGRRVSEPCGKPAACRVLPNVPKAFTTRSALPTHRRPSPPA